MAGDGSRDLALLMDQMSWPRWPLMPLKRYPSRSKSQGNWPDFAVALADTDERKPTILLDASLFGDPEDWKKCEKKEYDSWEAVVADGWRVD